MWHIDNVITPTGDQGATWGGLGASVGPRPLTTRLGPENSAYIESAGDLGGTAPDCCAQFMAWLKTLQLSTDDEGDALGGWLSCALRKAYISGLAAATFLVVAAPCIAGGPAGLAAAAAVLAAAGSIVALAAAGGITAQAVAEAAFITFFAVGAAAFVGSIIDEIWKRTGACDGTSVTSRATLPVVTV